VALATHVSCIANLRSKGVQSHNADAVPDDEDGYPTLDPPQQISHRTLEGPSAFIAPPNGRAVEVVQTIPVAAHSGTGSTDTVDVAPTLHPQNPSVVVPLAVRPLSQLHPDIIPGFRVDSKYLVIPDAVRRKFISRNTHIPLNLLTDAACTDSGADTSASMAEYLCVDQATGQLVQVDKTISHNTELQLTYLEWLGAWKRLLQLYKEHRPEEYTYWKVHFKRIRDQPAVTTEDWGVWVAYNAEIRKLRVTNPIDPSIFHKETWDRLYIKSLHQQASVPIKPKQEWASGRQTSATSSARAIKADTMGQSYSGQPLNSFRVCILCGRTTHSMLKCTESKLFNNGTMYLQRRSDGSWGDSNGRRLCFRFNSASRRGCTTYPCSSGDHRCSLCGEVAHNAQRCSLLGPTVQPTTS
jgi:hypothetical protein